MKNLKISFFAIFAFTLFAFPLFGQGTILKADLPPSKAIYVKIKGLPGDFHNNPADGINIRVIDWGKDQMSPIKIGFENKEDAEKFMRQFPNNTTQPSTRIILKSQRGNFQIDLTSVNAEFMTGDINLDGTVDGADLKPIDALQIINFRNIVIRRI